MLLLIYQNFIEMTSKMIYIVAFGVGLKCPPKIHLNTQWGWGAYYAHHITTGPLRFLDLPTALLIQERERMEKRRLELRSATGSMQGHLYKWTEHSLKFHFLNYKVGEAPITPRAG